MKKTLCVCVVSGGKEQTMKSEFVLKLLKCEEHKVFLLSCSNFSLFLKIKYCNKSEICLNKNNSPFSC